MVDIYTTSTCAYCPQVKKYLDYKNIKYNEKNIEEPNNLEDYKVIAQRHGKTTVPMVTDGEGVVFGYNPGQLAKFA